MTTTFSTDPKIYMKIRNKILKKIDLAETKRKWIYAHVILCNCIYLYDLFRDLRTIIKV